MTATAPRGVFAPNLPPLLIHNEPEPDMHVLRAPKVMVIAPGPLFSVFDVYEGAVNGLRAAGAQVQPLDYHNDLRIAAALEATLREHEDQDALSAFRSATTYAGYRAMAVAMATAPDLVLAISGNVFDSAHAGLLGRYTRTAVWLTESPYQMETELRLSEFYRIALTNERRMVARIKDYRRERGHPCPDEVYYLPHGFDPARHYPRDPEPEYQSDVLFIGTGFPERKALLGGVDWTGIDFRAFGVFDDTDLNDTMNTGGRTTLPNAEAQRWYAGAKININHHRTIRYYGSDQQIAADEAESLNPRVYELAAGRCFQVCDDSRPELSALFGGSVPTYRAGDSADLERVIRYYLDRPGERAACATEAHRRVQPFALDRRMRWLLETCLPEATHG